MATKKATAKKGAEIPAGPYVYALVDRGEVFYVGKGRRRRMFQHLLDAKRGKPGPKCERLRAMLAAGREVEYSVLGVYDSDQEAGAAEREQIARFAPATNLTAGGELGSWSPRARISLRAANCLGRMKSLPEWLATVTDESRNEIARHFQMTPEAFYWDCRRDLEREMANPSPNMAIVMPNGSVELRWF